MANRPEVEAVLDRWELGQLSNQDAAGLLLPMFQFAVRTRWWRLRMLALGEPCEAADGLLYAALLAVLPKYLRCYETKLLTLALQQLKSDCRTMERQRDRELHRLPTRVQRMLEKAARLEGQEREDMLDSAESLQRLHDTAHGAAERMHGAKPCFLDHLGRRARSMEGRQDLVRSRRALLLQAAAGGAPMAQAAEVAGLSTESARKVLLDEWLLFGGSEHGQHAGI